MITHKENKIEITNAMLGIKIRKEFVNPLLKMSLLEILMNIKISLTTQIRVPTQEDIQ